MIVPAQKQSYFVRLAGVGEPVLLLHGFTGSAKQWQRVIDQSSTHFQWIGIDLPGHGKTIIREEKSMEDHVDELLEVMNQLEIDRFHVIGYSMGGRTALIMANRYPNRVKSLVLAGASPGLKTDDERSERKASDEKLAEFIEEKGIEAFVDYWENIPLFKTQSALPEEMKKAIHKERLFQTEHGLALSLKTMGTGVMPSMWEHLENINQPTLLVTGQLDEKFKAINEKMLKHLPQAEFQTIEETGHAVHVENPESFGKIVSEFLEKQLTTNTQL